MVTYTSQTATASTTQIWTLWNVTYTVTGGTGGTSVTGDVNLTSGIWGAWTANVTSASTTLTGGHPYGSTVWTAWNENRTPGGIDFASREEVQRYAARRPVANADVRRWRELEAAQRIREDGLRAKLVEETRLRLQADARAEKILREHLTDEQRRDLDEKSFFYLESIEAGGARRKYRIDKGTHGNVKVLDDEGKKVVGSYCVQPVGVPVADAMLAQVLHLRHDPEGFKKAANFRGWG